MRARAGLCARLARVKVFVPRAALGDEAGFRRAVRERVVRLFPEVAARGGVGDEGAFSLAVGNVRVEHGDDAAFRREVARFEGGDVYAEMLLRNLPPPPPPVSERRLAARAAAREALEAGADWRMVSFYAFRPMVNPELAASRAAKLWRDLGVTGRVYFAAEGVNAQLAVPVPLWREFVDVMSGAWDERDVPREVVGAFLNVDQDVGREAAPFEKLHVRVRVKVLADGLDEPLDWTRAGTEVAPEQWHKLLVEANGGGAGADKPIVLDCRNSYESDVGRFVGSEPAGTKNFRETWDWLETRLDGVPAATPIMTFCTGGIRCAKVNAYLEQKMGFTNTSRLAGGIVSYARMLRAQNRTRESQFKGVNHVFDGRVGEAVTDDVLDRCINCGAPCNIQTDCANVRCARSFETRIFVQCPDCASRLVGACSHECRDVVLAAAPSASFPYQQEPTGRDVELDPLVAAPAVRTGRVDRQHDAAYADAMSGDEPPLLAELRAETEARFPSRSHMVSGPLEASLLRMLVGLTNSRRLLEIGTFTGYSALHMARGLPDGGVLVTCERDEEVAAVAASYFARDRTHGGKIDLRLGPARETLDAIAAAGEAPFDLVFLDADKNYSGYYELLMGGVLRVGGLMVVDNVLFRGQVSQIWAEGASSDPSFPSSDGHGLRRGQPGAGVSRDVVLARRRLKSLENVRKIARKLDSFNRLAAEDSRAECVMLPVRDGISLIRRLK
jgi:predicted sulfurtransferase/predicted O-methyltransferase YrrM